MIKHFEGTVTQLLDGLHKENVTLAALIAALPHAVKGYGHIKRRNMESWLVSEKTMLETYHQPTAPIRQVA